MCRTDSRQESLLTPCQDPEKPGFRCLQGLVNLHPCGPNDGGLIVCKGSHNLSAQFHEELKDEPRIPAWTKEWYGFTDRGMQWLKGHGGEWIKVCADPGDLIVWDSRTAHYNVPVKGEIDRMAVYTCFMPVTDATQEDLLRKKAAYEGKIILFRIQLGILLTSCLRSPPRNYPLAQRQTHRLECCSSQRKAGSYCEGQATERRGVE